MGKHIHIPFRCRNVFHVNDIFDDKKVVFDYQSADAKFHKQIEEQAKKVNQVAEKAFSYHEIQREIEYRMRNDKPKDYCWRVSNKIAHYIQKIHNFDVLRMDVDFFIDENKRIWLVHIDNVVIRNNELSSMTKILRGIKLKGLEVIKKIKDKMIEDNLVSNDEEFNQKLNAYR